jgi:DNA-binding NarL/FixJ family response regulator
MVEPRLRKAVKVRKLQVLLADDHPQILTRVKQLLEPKYEVVGTVGDGQSLVNAAANSQPDVLVIDISMPIMTGIEAAKIILMDGGYSPKIVFLTIAADPDFVNACFAAGASGFVVKARLTTDLLIAITEALADRIFISPSL